MTHHEAGAGPEHGPAHRGDGGSPEPGGLDEFDHQPAGPAGLAEDAQAQLVQDAQEQAGESGSAQPSEDTHVQQAEEAQVELVEDAQEQLLDGEQSVETTQASSSPEDPSGLAAERLEDLRRLQAEYVNYKKRVDRERMRAREQGIASTLEALLPVLDDIHLARQHGDLVEGPFAAIAEKLESVLGRQGIERFGSAGEQFDPLHHDALMHVEADLDPAVTTTTVVQVLQPGYRLGERVVRAARVAVADPQ